MQPDLMLHETKPLFDRIRENEKQRVPDHIILILLLFWILFAIDLLLSSYASGVIRYLCAQAGYSLSEHPNAVMTAALFRTVIAIILVLLYTEYIEARPLSTLLIGRRRMLPDYLTGGILGFAAFTAVILIAWLGGAVQPFGAATAPNLFWMMLLSLGWMIQGFSEEILVHGMLMTSVGTYHKAWTAVAVSAVCFALMHFGNSGFSMLACINLLLYAIVMALYVLRTESLWGAAAFHSVWNWAQGNFFGMQVSGIQISDTTVFHFSQTGDAVWLGGAVFGLEAGLGTTLILIIMLTVLLLFPQRGKRYRCAMD